MEKKPGHFLVFKIIGFIGVAIAVIGLINLISGFGSFHTQKFLIGMFMMPIGFFLGFTFLMLGFRPEVSKMASKSVKYIQQENKDVLKDIASTNADINSDAVTITAKAFKEGFKDTVFCKHCGKEIDADSKFCRYCGKEL